MFESMVVPLFDIWQGWSACQMSKASPHEQKLRQIDAEEQLDLRDNEDDYERYLRELSNLLANEEARKWDAAVRSANKAHGHSTDHGARIHRESESAARQQRAEEKARIESEINDAYIQRDLDDLRDALAETEQKCTPEPDDVLEAAIRAMQARSARR